MAEWAKRRPANLAVKSSNPAGVEFFPTVKCVPSHILSLRASHYPDMIE